MSELKPCPFCSGEAEVEKSGSGVFDTWYVNCLSCCASVWENTEAEAIEVWNTRYGATCDGCVCYDNRGDYFTCESCARAYPDLYRPKEEKDA